MKTNYPLPLYAIVNLTDKTWEPYPIPKDFFKKFVGGKSLGSRLLFEFMPSHTDVFDPASVVVVNTGPLTGSGAPSTSRFNLCAKNVLTGGIATSNCGGTFGMMLRRAGFDGVIIMGASDAPCYLEILDGEIAFRDAAELWGKDTEAAQEHLPKPYGKLMIGPAGENKVSYAGLASGERMAGRCGIGAIFGSKKLKGLVAYGTKEIPVAQPERFYAYNKKWIRFLQNHSMTGDALPRYGSAGLVNKANSMNALPTKNFESGHYDAADKVSGETLAETRLTRNGSCVSCPIRCERRVRLENKEVKGPEYETLGLFGPNMGLHDIDLVIRLNYVCDILGIDTISCASTIAFAMELYEKGLADFGVRFGKADNLEEVIYKIANAEGIYAELGKGSKWLSRKYGGEDFAIHAKGMELAAYEPRRSVGMGLGYATSNRGGCHLNGGYGALVESIGVLSIRPTKRWAKPDWVVFLQNALDAISLVGCCLFSGQTFIPNILFKLGPNHIITRSIGFIASFTGPVIRLLLKFPLVLQFNTFFLMPHAESFHRCTGMHMTTGDFIRTGERCYNVERLFNVREGLTGKQDALPKRLTKDFQKYGGHDTTVPIDKMLPIYYRARGWDKNGCPTRRTLKKLGMSDLLYVLDEQEEVA
ncbi:MAG: aldehyde ferredoxin oxidoreductase family protein [Oscillospiraceae bacterium]|jgi:aldehyde:ferredoxin oxidoreductase|nr:aldehyde ferredoxin oxidoreductase family protein [Oscillospiraceae bacterium]